MILRRDEFREDGIFGSLRVDHDTEIAKTLEHSYRAENGLFLPKIPNGNFLCAKGKHVLGHGKPFETFEVTGVPGHTGILFHVGNTNADSSGCILLGQEIDHGFLMRSRIAFENFMKLLECVEAFTLNVV